MVANRYQVTSSRPQVSSSDHPPWHLEVQPPSQWHSNYPSQVVWDQAFTSEKTRIIIVLQPGKATLPKTEIWGKLPKCTRAHVMPSSYLDAEFILLAALALFRFLGFCKEKEPRHRLLWEEKDLKKSGNSKKSKSETSKNGRNRDRK